MTTASPAPAPGQPTGQPTGPPTGQPTGPPPGLTVDGYRLLTRIGEGGMGVVHLAQRPGGARVALKVLRPHIVGDEEARQRLSREVGSLSRIRHVGVAEIVDSDPWGDVPYVATRYVPGLSLHDHVREEGPIPAGDLVWFATRLGEALMAVHAQGVLHRDVKPSNVLMEGRAPILIDFGLARVADDPKLTHTGWLLGTPGFLAPEILHGDDATTASDVHAWAATVAFAGTGRAPFGRGPSMAIMDRVRRGEHDLSGLPQHVRSVLVGALHPDPRQRPSLLEAVRRLQEPPPVPTARRTVDKPFEDDFFTTPLALASSARAHDVTHPEPTYVDPTLNERADSGWHDPWAMDPRFGPTPPAPKPPLGVRLRTSGLLVATGLAMGGAIGAYPYLATFLVVIVVWLLRSGSLAASAASNRRMLRGRSSWYDGPQLLLATPWHLVQSVPGTLMLALWGLGLATAAALLGYAFALGVPWTLAFCGVTFMVGLWLGPGGSRVRGPVRRVVRPLTARPALWLVTTALVLASASLAGWSVDTRGPDWAPADDHLLAGFSLDSFLPGLR
ncbi:serine/threonine-protein kinase [Nocardioides bigeumensis]|uniref:serine/threonine-protein kinase n=1 Tax=Nocardioides bigeumensis TaxID=433657 RepID=UPI0031E17581